MSWSGVRKKETEKMDPKKVSALIVTYNRKNALLRCLKAVIAQTFKVDSVILVDNASSDGTLELLQEEGLINRTDFPADVPVPAGNAEGTKIFVLRKQSNTGGSGGFSAGMKAADEKLAYDYLWLMDDDGYPDRSCLKKLMCKIDAYGYVMPVSFDINAPGRLSCPIRKKNGRKTTDFRALYADYGEILHFVTPFNGVLLTKECVRKTGYIDPKFFLWGDEYDHCYRCRQQGYNPVTYLRARFFHPSDGLPLIPILGGLIRVPYTESKLRMVCLARNYTYIYLHYGQQYRIPLKLLLYAWLFLVKRRGDMDGFRLYLASVSDGFRGDFTRHLKYL